MNAACRSRMARASGPSAALAKAKLIVVGTSAAKRAPRWLSAGASPFIACMLRIVASPKPPSSISEPASTS